MYCNNFSILFGFTEAKNCIFSSYIWKGGKLINVTVHCFARNSSTWKPPWDYRCFPRISIYNPLIIHRCLLKYFDALNTILLFRFDTSQSDFFRIYACFEMVRWNIFWKSSSFFGLYRWLIYIFNYGIKSVFLNK